MPPRGDRAHDKLYKVRPLLDVISDTFREEYNPSKFVSIDEAMVKYKGRLGFKQYLPMKPIKHGIKVWVRADATNGFVCALQVYTGKDGGQPEHGLGHRVVSDLVHGLHGKNYHIFVIIILLLFVSLKICWQVICISVAPRVRTELTSQVT